MIDIINNKMEFENILEQVIAETTQLIESNQEIEVYDSILQQLLFIKQVRLEEKRHPTEEECDSIMIGNIAVKNFETDMPDYSRKLVELDYYFEFYDEL